MSAAQPLSPVSEKPPKNQIRQVGEFEAPRESENANLGGSEKSKSANLGAFAPSENPYAGTEAAEIAERLRALGQQLNVVEPSDVSEALDLAAEEENRAARSRVRRGYYLLWAKERTPHGEFLPLLRKLHIPHRSAERAMLVARLLMTPVAKQLRLINLPQSKLEPLARVDPDVLEEAAKQGWDPTALDCMSVEMLQDRIRKLEARNETAAKQVESLKQENWQLRSMDGVAVAGSEYPASVTRTRSEAAVLSDQALARIGAIRRLADELPRSPDLGERRSERAVNFAAAARPLYLHAASVYAAAGELLKALEHDLADWLPDDWNPEAQPAPLSVEEARQLALWARNASAPHGGRGRVARGWAGPLRRDQARPGPAPQAAAIGTRAAPPEGPAEKGGAMSTVSGQVVAMPERAAALPPSVSSRRSQSKLVRFDPRVLERVRVCRRIDKLVDSGYSLSHVIGQLRGRDASLPSAGTLRRLHAAWIAGGVAALMDRRRGRQRKPYGWEVRAIELYNSPTRPAMATVAYWLRGEGYPGATNSRVRRYFGSLPAAVAGENSPKRAGWHYYKQNLGPYVRRDRRVIEVGLIYEGDGHLSDVFVRHPASGGHYRPELTIWIDIRSGYVTGFGLSDAESAVSTLHSLCHALKSEDHVPAALHVDPGSGFINRLLTDESLGWLRRLGIDIITEEPGNAKGKGLIEGWFRWFEERVGKRFSSYCGHCRTDDDIRRLKNSIRDKRVKLPSLPQYAEAIKEYIAAYNHTPQPNLGCAPADIWASLERNPVGIPPEALPRPSEERVARRGAVEFYNRVYRAPELLLLLDGRRVEVEYDFFDDSRVWINHDGQRVCVAKLAERRRWAEESRIADLKAKRKRGREKRLRRGLREIEAQARPVIDAEAHAHAAEIVAPEEPQPEGEDDFVDYL